MKTLSNLITFLLLPMLFWGCVGKSGSDKKQAITVDTITVPDTGFTGIKNMMSNGILVREVSYKNGVRNGETKTYHGGYLYQTFWYENDLRQDSGKWYYNTGQVFRSTPYVNDTVHGIVVQYYKNGKVRARLGYDKGKRTTFFQEYYQNGFLYKDYPEIVTSVIDEYQNRGTYTINLSLSLKDQNVNFYRGSFINNCFDTAVLQQLTVTNGTSSIVLRKGEGASVDTVGIIAAILSPFGNRYLTSKTVQLPYGDLK